MPIEFFDDFDDTNNTFLTDHTPDVGTAWINEFTTPNTNVRYEIDSGSRCSPTEFEPAERMIVVADPAPSSEEYDVKLRLDLPTNYEATSPIFAVARYQDASTFYFAGGYSANSGSRLRYGLYLGKIFFDRIVILDAKPNIGLKRDSLVRFHITNDVKELYIDEILALRTTDNGIDSAGRAGMANGAWINSVDQVRGNAFIDSFEINTTVITEPSPTVIPYERVPSGPNSQVALYRWPGLSEGTVGQALENPKLTRKTIQTSGVFGGGIVVVQGSVALEGTFANQFVQLSNFNSSPVEFLDSSIIDGVNHAFLYRPVVYGGSGMNVDVYLLSVED